MAMADSEPTSHGLTSRAAKVVWGSVGARTAAWLAVVLGAAAKAARAVREGTASLLETKGSSSSTGDSFLRFREDWESRDSSPELSWDA
jgi:hypothetical protein